MQTIYCNVQASSRPSIGSVCQQVYSIAQTLGIKLHCEEALPAEVPEEFVRPAYEEPDTQDEPPLAIRELFEKVLLLYS
jgi:ribosomal protein S10